MARLPLCARNGLLEELELIALDRRRLDNAVIVSPERAQERREGLDRWERDLREQLAELDLAAIGAKVVPA